MASPKNELRGIRLSKLFPKTLSEAEKLMLGLEKHPAVGKVICSNIIVGQNKTLGIKFSLLDNCLKMTVKTRGLRQEFLIFTNDREIVESEMNSIWQQR